jgi:hypothetical protein
LIHEINVRHRDRCENYKGIALGNAAYKILENIILKKIKPYIEKKYQGLSEWIYRWKICN